MIEIMGPLELTPEGSGGEPLERRIGQLPAMPEFLSLAIAISAAVAQVHALGLIHKDIKPANILVDSQGRVFLTGFEAASRCPRERQTAQPPEALAGTLPYMAPEQTGRMNRSIDSRSDLYSLGTTLYELLTGRLPFTGVDPLDWIHCHVARQPTSPRELRPQVPEVIAQILLKLLAKSADERYQTALGLEADWRRCLEQWQAAARVDPFTLGEQDAPDHLVIPETLYGRDPDLAALRSAYDGVAAAGTPQFILFTGYAGVGKSALVHEYHRELVAGNWFAAGKSDPYHRDIPYTTLTRAFAGLVRQLLCLPEKEIVWWRDRLAEALGINGRIILDLIPDLGTIIGPQHSVAEVSPQDAMNRFRRVVCRFLGVFATAEQPLILFFDDLQWLDAATLELLEHLLTEPEMRHLLLIGAYRDNEVDGTHPLAVTLNKLRARGASVTEMMLFPLRSADVAQLVGDALHCSPGRVRDLADLVHLKTHGNPFFAIQFLTHLEQEGFLRWRGAQEGWSWDTTSVHAQGFTDNVVHLLVGKLGRLSPGALAALQRLACFGSTADAGMLTRILDVSPQDLHEAMGEAVSAGLVLRVGEGYRFVHDRVQEAAYSLIPEQERAPAHLRIGRGLCARMRPEEITEHVFEVVNQLNRGHELIADPHERRTLAELNLEAGARARQSSAYAAALTYAKTGSALLPENRWTQCPDIHFKLEFLTAECEFLTGSTPEADSRLAALAMQASGPSEAAAVACLRQLLYAVLGRNDRAVEVCLDYLRQQGIVWRAQPTEEDVQAEYARLWEQLHGRGVEDLASLPRMVEPQQRAVLDVLASVLAMALMTNANQFRLIVCRMASLSVQYGNCDGSTLAYVYLNFIVGDRLGDYALGLRFGKLAMALLDQGLRAYRARVEVAYGTTVLPWTQPMRSGLVWVRRSIQSGQEGGDLTFACYSWFLLIPVLLCAGEPLGEVLQEAERALQFARKLNFNYMIELIGSQVAFLRAMRGLTPELSSFTHQDFDELGYETRLREDPGFHNAGHSYWVRKLQAYFHAQEYALAIVAAARARESHWEALHPFEKSEYHFHAALAHAARCEHPSTGGSTGHRDALAAHVEFLAAMAANCPENFAARASLVAAELARVNGEPSRAEALYDRAVNTAREAGLVHDEAVALEIAARHYRGRGIESVAYSLLRSACACYQQWGAIAKVRILERQYPRLREPSTVQAAGGTIAMPLVELDAVSVIEAAQAVSSEIVPEMLIRRLLTLSVKQAGAERGLLILVRDGTARIEAEARTDQTGSHESGIVVDVRQAQPGPNVLPNTVLQLVLRTQQCVTVQDAATLNSFPRDYYLRHHRPRSVLCQPLLRQGRLIGMLYLENKLVAGVFTPSRTAVLEVLAAQAAISLENAYLYADLRERESRIRRLFDSNMVGIVFWTVRGDIADANDAFLHLVRRSRESLLSGQLTWQAITPPEYRNFNDSLVEQIRSGDMAPPHELELLLPDKTRVAVMIGGTLLEGTQERGVSFVLDLTARRWAQSEREARRVAEAANSAKTEFLTTMSHELRTPLNAILGYAQILERDLTLSARQRQQSATIRDSGEHLLKLINDVLDLAKIEAGRMSLELAQVSLADLLTGVREITLVKAREKGLELTCHIAPDLPQAVWADMRRLRQVLLNLLMNAVKFTDRGWVSLSVAPCSGNRIRFEVHDTGIGISADHLQSLFQPFEQVGDLERRASGTGLGLAISRKLVRLMGGDIHVTSQAVAGSTFWFELEMLPAVKPAPASAPNGVMLGYRGRRRVVLVVDDVAESRAVLADMLTPLGFVVVEADSGRQALSVAQSRPPDLVITDLGMPEMDGRELVRCLRETADFSRAPIIVASASPMARAEREDCAADAFLTKPLDAPEVLLRMAALLAIEWIYETPEDPPAPNLGEFLVPPLHEMQLLRSLAREDKLQQIIRWSERVGHNPRYHRFARQVATLASQYESQALLSFVEQHLDSTV